MVSAKVIFIDSTVADYQTLASGAINGAEVIILNPEQNGIAQITDYLRKNAPVDSIHIVSHGSPATLYLGNTTLSLSNLNNYQEHLSSWSAKAIYLYGCNVAVGDAGEEFVTKLHEITGASIAASKTLTGNAGLGGDWNLEVTRGEITSDFAFSPEARQAYAGVLATYTVDILQDQDDGVNVNGTSLRDAIEAANNNSGADTIVFKPSLNGAVINLTLGDLTIESDLTITGNKSNRVSISGSGQFRVFSISSSANNVTLSGLKIINGNSGGPGGIYNYARNLSIFDSEILNNQGSYGAGIYNEYTGSKLTLINSTVAYNTSSGSGGGIQNGTLGSTLTLINSTVAYNTASDSGGGIFNEGSALLVNTTISNNTAKGLAN